MLFVYGDAERLLVCRHLRVHWIGAIHRRPAGCKNYLKTPPAESDVQTAMYNVAVFNQADLDEVAEQILNTSGGRLLAKCRLDRLLQRCSRRNEGHYNNVAAVTTVAVDS
jgi:hypothetical protein